MKGQEYTGEKVKNQFTAYLQKFIRSKRRDYLKSKIFIDNVERPLEENVRIDNGIMIEDLLENREKERLMLRERQGVYPKWNELSDQKLIGSLMKLSEDERRMIYQHVFEERTFKEIGILNGLSDGRVKAIYYYAIWKIRKWMGGDR